MRAFIKNYRDLNKHPPKSEFFLGGGRVKVREDKRGGFFDEVGLFFGGERRGPKKLGWRIEFIFCQTPTLWEALKKLRDVQQRAKGKSFCK